jgi:catechol 2,3-dioxygenase-like lactoylglutathione lyase family enzyme
VPIHAKFDPSNFAIGTLGGVEAARAFYTTVLGLREVPKPDGLLKLGGAWFTNGRVELHVGAEENFRAARKAHPALIVDSLDQVLQAARDFGGETAGAAASRPAPRLRL